MSETEVVQGTVELNEKRPKGVSMAKVMRQRGQAFLNSVSGTEVVMSDRTYLVTRQGWFLKD